MFKMAETNNIYPNLSPTLSNNQQFRLNRINEIRDYFVAKIDERELMSKRLSKYIASFGSFQSCIVNFYRNHKKAIKNNKKEEEKT